MKEALIAFLVAMVIGAAINGFTSSNAPPPPASDQSQNKSEASPSASADAFPSSLPQTTDVAFDRDVLKSDKPVLVDFYADWCGPCKKMAPVLDKLAGQYTGKMSFYRINTDENPSVTNRYGVTSIPTFMIFSKGQRGETFNGEVPEELLSTAINKATQ